MLKDNTYKINKIKKINREGRKVDVQFFAIHLTEHEALLLEKSLIETYGVKDDGGQLTNVRYGSLDPAGIWTDKRKEEHSTRLRGKNSKVTELLVSKAKIMSFYLGKTAKEISNNEEFVEYNVSPHTIKSWCRGDKYSYVLPHLNHTQADLAEEKRQDCLKLYLKGYDASEISKILGLDNVHHYIKDYRDINDVALLNEVVSLIFQGYSYPVIATKLNIGNHQPGRMWRGEYSWDNHKEILMELRSVGAFQ